LLFHKNNPAPYLGASTPFLFPPSTGPLVAFLILRFTRAILNRSSHRPISLESPG
jgi:hypothetical protein